MIKTPKRAIMAILSNAYVKDKKLMTAFCGAKALINTKPLMYQSADIKDTVPQFAPKIIDEVGYDPKRH